MAPKSRNDYVETGLVPANTIVLNRSPFMHEWVAAWAARDPDAPAIATQSIKLTYAELADHVRVLAGHLGAQRIGPGDRVLVALPNVPASIVAALAINVLGATSVEVSRTWNDRALTEILAGSKARHAVIWGHDSTKWAGVFAQRSLDHVWVVAAAAPPAASVAGLGPVSWLLEDGSVDPATPRAPITTTTTTVVGEDEPAIILYTSGSTGRPHGVVQTHRNIDANTRSIVEYLRLTADDRALLTLPLYYCYGRSVVQTHLFVGGSTFLLNGFAFPRRVLEMLASEQCTGFAGVPMTFEILRRQVDVSSMAFPRLRYVTQAGGGMSPETVAWVRREFQPAEVFVMYGQTEATARLSYLPPARASDKEGSIGIPIPGVELRIVDSDGSELPVGVTGELIARGDNVTPGYLDEPAATAQILRDGWLWTGDLAYRDADGYYFHRGRAKEVLKIGGHRVSPVEIEQVVASHPDVMEAAVIGAPHELMGEVPVAFVVFLSGRHSSDAELRSFCRERLPAYMVPTRFIAREPLPRSEAGKVLRATLVEANQVP